MSDHNSQQDMSHILAYVEICVVLCYYSCTYLYFSL